jgi:hypothetical protein
MKQAGREWMEHLERTWLQRMKKTTQKKKELGQQVHALLVKCARLKTENDALKADVDLYKRIADRNHRANLMPCPNCGYRQAEVKPNEAN